MPARANRAAFALLLAGVAAPAFARPAAVKAPPAPVLPVCADGVTAPPPGPDQGGVRAVEETCITPAARDAAATSAPLRKNSDVPNHAPAAAMEPAPPVDHKALEPQPVVTVPLDPMLDGRRRPGAAPAALPEATVQVNPGAVYAPPPSAFPTDELPIPDRWRLITALCPDKNFVAVQAVCRRQTDPYHQNLLKGDRPLDRAKVPWLPIKGDDWFLVLNGTSDSVVEPRSFPTPVGVQTTARPGSLDVFGKGSSLVFSQTFIASAALIKGSTAFMPPHIEYRLTLAYNYNYVDVNERRILDVRPSAPTHRTDSFLGVQEAFVDYHLRNVSDRYDFDSVRVGIQDFQADFRGFLFNDSALGFRVFGNRDNNRFQYNFALFRRLEKDTNSGLNDLGQTPRDDYVFLANVYRQDFPVPGFTSQLIGVYNRNREGNSVQIDHNGFPVRPALLGDLRGHDYDAYYVGYNGDGHFDRLNLTVSVYGVFGRDSHNFLTGDRNTIRAFFAAAEPSIDFSWIRVRGAAMYASGDSNPYDKTETGYDAILENPIFAGADTSYWIRQTIPFAGGGRVIGVNGRNGILADLRSSKDQGQSNFINPGTILAGAGADFDLTPTLRLSVNANHLWFETTKVLQVLRSEGTIPKQIGWDLSAATIWRPKMTQNVVVRLSGALLDAGKGFRDLFDQRNGSRVYYSVLGNVILSF